MSKLFDETMHGLVEAVSIKKGELPIIEKENMPAPTFAAADKDIAEERACIGKEQNMS